MMQIAVRVHSPWRRTLVCMLGWLACGCLFATGCSRPRPPEGVFACASNKDCPKDWVCNAQLCYSSATNAGSAASADAGQAPHMIDADTRVMDAGNARSDVDAGSMSVSDAAAPTISSITVRAMPADLGELSLGDTADTMISVHNDTRQRIGPPVLSVADLTVGTLAFQANTCTKPLEPGEACSARGRLATTSSSISENDFFVTATSNPGGTGMAALSVRVRAAAFIELGASNLNLGAVAYGETSAATSVRLTNRGGGATGMLQVAVTGSQMQDFAVSHDCPAMLGAGASCDLSLTVTPSDLGVRGAALEVSADPGGTAIAMVSATGDYAYSRLDDANRWATFDVTTLNAAARGFVGSAYDGRYLYLVPFNNSAPDGLVARYDTQASFAAGSWSTFDTTSLRSDAKGFQGAAFDGHYLYLVPHDNGAPDGVIARYDTRAGFSASSSWTTFDVTSVNPNAKGFRGAVFDGRYLYLVPSNNGAPAGIVARYDTQSGLSDPSAWTTFDTTRVEPNAKGFWGAVFDGDCVYFVPFDNGATSSIALRYDVHASLTDPASWIAFDTTTLHMAAKEFFGAAYDGRYVYFAPSNGDNGSILVRYDTATGFEAMSSWATFDASTVHVGAKGFQGAVFDGRYVYFVPYNNGQYDGQMLRYDTRASFTVASSYATYDATTLDPNAKGFLGAAFDGRYVYFVPDDDGTTPRVLTRFDAQSPRAMPQLCGSAGALYCYSGSFF